MREAPIGPSPRALLSPRFLGHHLLMPRHKAKDAERVSFIAPLGNRALYKEIAALEGLPVDSWIRETLYQQAVRTFEAHDRSIDDIPPAHFRRPPRLQPRLLPDDLLPDDEVE